jgi:hypothetical protein
MRAKINASSDVFRTHSHMPRGRKIIGRPTSIAAPRSREDADALIDAALQGWTRDDRVRSVWSAKPEVRDSWPSAARVRIAEPSWIDASNHPKNWLQRGRPANHYRALVLKAVTMLQEQRGWTRYRAQRYVADRLLSLLPVNIAERVLNIPDNVVAHLSDDARHAAARKWIIRRLTQAPHD